MPELGAWQNFFVMTGGAAAALIGLMFVAVSLGFNMITPENEENIRAYVNPSLHHFVIVLLTACAMLIPIQTQVSLAVMIGLLGLVGVRQMIHVGRVMWRHRRIDSKQDWFSHFILPLLSYGIGCGVAAGLAITGRTELLAGVVLMVAGLIVCAIYNIWTLILWIALQRQAG